MTLPNYDANVSDLISPRASFSVKVVAGPDGKAVPPGDFGYRDFKPNKTVPSVVVSDDKIRKKNFMRPPTTRYEQDYISPEDSAVKRKNEKASIIEIAKQIYKDEENRRTTYNNARKLVESGGPDEAAVTRAQKILDRGAPLTKEQALEKAAEQFYGLRS